MQKLSVVLGLMLLGLPLLSCGQQARDASDVGWMTLLDGSSFDHWTRVGNANWRVVDGIVQADQGNGHLVSRNSYGDFQIRAESATSPVVLGEKEDGAVLGAVTLETLGFMLNPLTREILPMRMALSRARR